MALQTPALPGPVPEAAAPDTRRLLALPGMAAVAGALAMVGISFAILLDLTPIPPGGTTTLVLIGFNAAFILALCALIARELHRIYTARNHSKAASRLHVRIVALFSLVAAIPALMVAVVASVTLDLGLDRWFELRTRIIINSSLSIAEAYVMENARNLQGTTVSMAGDLDANRTIYALDRTGFRNLLSIQARGRGLQHAALVRGDGSVVMNAETEADFDMPAPYPEVIRTAADGLPVLIPPGTRNIVGAVVRLREFDDTYLYTIRIVDPEVIRARQIVRANTDEYRALEGNRLPTQLAFAMLYLGVTLIVVLSAIWTGIALADRLVRPIRQLIVAADEVASGNLDVAVPVRASDGDLGSLGNTFNNMIRQLGSQRRQLLQAKDRMDERRRFTEAVLSGVSAGVIGVDRQGTIRIVNRSAEKMLALSPRDALGRPLGEVLPHVGRVFAAARKSGRPVHREQAAFYRAGAERTFNVQVTIEDGAAGTATSYVVTVDDITDLVSAQRTTAWADVARRIAHEIKNPLTPIQLSAERIRRRFGKVITEDRDIFEQCTDTIVRQVGDIGRMVDEFSAFARMPKPDMQMLDLREPLREASFLVEVSRSDIAVTRDFGDAALTGRFDSRLLSQAFGNLIKNAAEAVDGARREGHEDAGAILVRARARGDCIVVEVLDDGRGLPRENRQRLLEPYMTTREKGTGLGLAIVKKIIEDHGGRLELHDAPAQFHGGRGAMIRIVLPTAREGAAPPEARPEDAENGKVNDGI